jgi:8-oxo-dGTP diphosphatase
MLLIHKKRGLGAGKINGPGGRLHLGESPLHGAVREVQEELCITPRGVQQCGELPFSLRMALPLWCISLPPRTMMESPRKLRRPFPYGPPLTQIPYDRTWANDRLWFPLMLAGKQFQGQMLFDGDILLGHHMTVVRCRSSLLSRS